MGTDTRPPPSRPRRRHTKEFKQESIKLALRADVGFARAAAELGIHPAMLYKWWKQSTTEGVHAFRGNGHALETELEQAHRRIRVLEMERDILKKAAAFFAKEQS